MTNLAFAWFLVAVLMSRVTLLGKDTPMSRGQALAITLVQGLALCLATPTLGQLGLMTVILVVNLGGAWMEHRNSPRLPLYRLLSLSAILVVAGFVYGPAGGVQLRPPVQAAGAWLVDHVLFFSSPGITSRHLIVLAGALLVINEANLLIRLILQRLDVAPRQPGARPALPSTVIILPASAAGPSPGPLDQREYNTGRFIGILERLLVYVLVLHNQYEAIGLILAAKSFARFRELDQREFAEYVLIGTLLSVGTAIAIGEAVKALT